jgi:3-dehydroquinate synthase
MKISNRIVTVNRTPVFSGKNVLTEMEGMIRNLHPTGVFILVDPNTQKHCLPILTNRSGFFDNSRIICIDGGENSKSLANAEKIWQQLLEAGADRSSLLVNLGGGVVSDLGGFVAAGYKRGIRYVNVPTSLIGQADASVGGKTAVNIGNLKNQVGFFYAAAGVFISPEFLKSLPAAHLRSGLAEVVKCLLIGDEAGWNRLSGHSVDELLQLPLDGGFWSKLVLHAVHYKNKLVMRDFREANHRKALNFGHTIGHALESFSMQQNETALLHGEAVAAGMICASYLSFIKTGLPGSALEKITKYLVSGFPPFPVDESSIPALMDKIHQDKKHNNRKTQFSLISKPGHPVINVECNEEEITDAVRYYNSALKGSFSPGD